MTSLFEKAMQEFVEEAVKEVDLTEAVENAMPNVEDLVSSALDDVNWTDYVTDPIKDEVRDQIKDINWSDEIGDLIREEILEGLSENTDVVKHDEVPKLVEAAVDNILSQPHMVANIMLLATTQVTNVMNSVEFKRGMQNRLAEVVDSEEFKLRLDVANRKSLERVLSGLGRVLFLR